MDMEKIKYDDVRASSQKLHSIAQNMKNSLDNILSYTQSLNGSGYWEGPASEYYINKMTKLINNFEEIFRELENSVLYLAKVTEGYQALDEKIIQEICNNLRISEPTLNTSKIFS